ncbi:MAG: nitrite reductase small subunit NirD [Candidatus Binatia bacterium]
MNTERILSIVRRSPPRRDVDLGPEETIPLGQGRAFLVGGKVIAIFRQRDGRLFAIDGRCPHRGGPLAEGIVGDGKVICPLHGWKIDLESGRCVGESAGVRAYAVERVDGRISLVLPEEG